MLPSGRECTRNSTECGNRAFRKAQQSPPARRRRNAKRGMYVCLTCILFFFFFAAGVCVSGRVYGHCAFFSVALQSFPSSTLYLSGCSE